jgi:tetratricopeptide (TPR) repeat protein
MRRTYRSKLLAPALVVLLYFGCSASSKVNSVIEGFFSEVNQSNFESAKSQYLSSVLISNLNSPQSTHASIQKSFGGLAGQIKSVDVTAVQVKGEAGSADASILMRWGTKYQGKMDLIKENGKEWKISEWQDFNPVGYEHLATARQDFRSKQLSQMASEFQLALAENPKDAEILVEWGSCYMLLGDEGQAEQKFKQAIAMYPDVVWDPYIYLAMIYRSKGDLPNAENALKKAISNKPDNANAYNSLAWFYADTGTKLDRALELAQKALALAPDNAYYLDTLGWAYYRRGERTEAVQYLTRALSKDPNNTAIKAHYDEVVTTAQVHLARAQQLSNQGRLDQALGECEAALRQEPNNENAKNLRGALAKQAAAMHVANARQAFERQQYNPASSECDVALRYDPQNTDAANLKAKIAEVKKVLGYQ